MEFLGVLLLCTQLLWSVQAVSNCPKECKCIEAGFGGSVAHCEQLNINQTFSTSFHHLNVTDSVPEKLFTLESKFFQKLELEELQTIKIINSSLSFIDKSAFDGMNSLNYLDLSDNLLTEIDPDTFINNDNLQQLSLSGNPLQNSIKSNYILKSRSLTDLDLSRCQLRQITSETFNELLNLRSLNLGSNFIHFLSQNMFEKLEFLEEINLSSNLINDLDQKLFLDIEDLTTLKLSNNSISKFDDVDISSLRELDLSYNIFKMLESTTLDGALDVTNVNFSHNMIERIDEDTFTDCNRLRYLDLSYNSLKGPLPESMFETNTELETLSLAHNPHLGIFDGFKGKFIALYRLDLSYCGLVQLEEKALVSFQYLSTLDLSGNLLTDLHPETFSKLSHLNNLDLSDNQLTTLNEDIFLGNMDLRKLILKGNRIHHLSAKLFQPVVHLNRLDVSKCHLNYLWNVNESIYMKENNILSQLDYLSLEGNKLKTMHKHIFESMNNLKTLDISKNPFQCDEQFVLVIEWLVQQKITKNHNVYTRASQKYNFGLGKRSSYNDNDDAEIDDDNMYDYHQSVSDIAKRSRYNFGLGKRNIGPDDFSDIASYDGQHDLFPRASQKFNFGLGKREVSKEDLQQLEEDILPTLTSLSSSELTNTIEENNSNSVSEQHTSNTRKREITTKDITKQHQMSLNQH